MEQPRITEPDLFPVLMTLDGAAVVVVGGGAVAERKVGALLECGARVTLVAPRLTPQLARLAADGQVSHAARPYDPGDLANAVLAFVAVDDPLVSAAVARDARRLRVPVNVVDRPELCTFIVPAVMRRGRLTIAVSTRGASPAWASRIKRRLSEDFGEEYGRLFEALAAVRRRCREEMPEPSRRRQILHGLVDDALVELARTRDVPELERILWSRVTRALEPPEPGETAGA